MTNDQPLTREAILDAAEQALRRYGPDKTSVVDVAKALQVSHGTLYRHFASKAALREAVTERWLRQCIAEPMEASAGSQPGTAAEQVRAWLSALAGAKRRYAAEDPEMFTMYAAVTQDAAELVGRHVDRLIGQLASIIERGMQEGQFKRGDAKRAARAAFLATSRFHHPAHGQEWLAVSADEDFEAVVDLLLSGLVREQA
ncbi:TetR/AcrR family transcriptional regulator [Paenibacillus lycopersici]|uniref:TetR/AcrR family transcriptional regulator n=1 Tax=Paenibacillus lycopersici TaxID=2704462 RepID=A0A6C0FT97_9BACL|nr:TetR family transcriptional regulator [Paenibacillus lycopersici]QHT58553.1 TetR/AcrR family transcriptional regulator [Paenibacillus lycopersici]